MATIAEQYANDRESLLEAARYRGRQDAQAAMVPRPIERAQEIIDEQLIEHPDSDDDMVAYAAVMVAYLNAYQARIEGAPF